MICMNMKLSAAEEHGSELVESLDDGKEFFLDGGVIALSWAQFS